MHFRPAAFSSCNEWCCLLMALLFGSGVTFVNAAEEVIRSARSGPWSQTETWTGGRVPGSGARVLIPAGQAVSCRDDWTEWEIALVLPVGGTLSARATDAAGNVEPRPHQISVP